MISVCWMRSVHGPRSSRCGALLQRRLGTDPHRDAFEPWKVFDLLGALALLIYALAQRPSAPSVSELD